MARPVLVSLLYSASAVGSKMTLSAWPLESIISMTPPWSKTMNGSPLSCSKPHRAEQVRVLCLVSSW